MLRTAKDICYGFKKIKTVYFSFMSFLVEFNRIETFWLGFNVGRISEHFWGCRVGGKLLRFVSVAVSGSPFH